MGDSTVPKSLLYALTDEGNEASDVAEGCVDVGQIADEKGCDNDEWIEGNVGDSKGLSRHGNQQRAQCMRQDRDIVPDIGPETIEVRLQDSVMS